jgi:hypothetical protein
MSSLLTGIPIRSVSTARSGCRGNQFLSLHVDAHIATQMGVPVFTFEIMTPGVHVTFFSFPIGLKVVLHGIGHDAPPDLATDIVFCRLI